MSRRSLGTAALLVALASTPTPAHAGTFFRLDVGPPIAAGTAVKDKKTVFVVRPRLCDDAGSVRVTGTVEGLVNGTRQSMPLRIAPLSTPGVYAVQNQWGDGRWIVHLTGTCPATRAVTSAFVPVMGSTFVRSRVELLPQAATPAQVDAALQAFAGGSR